ncbi:MAG: hypothetical protein H0W83_05060, partial [Planctomycetes bacterium]|nr:hypothetical protein [Planctomycetota bacterium]
MVLVRLIALLSLMLCAAHSAERLRLDDVRAFGGMVAQDLTTRSTTNGVDSHIDSDALNARVGLEYMRGKLGRHGGFIYGAAFSANRFSYDEAGVRTTLNEPTIEALAGYGIAPARTVHCELTAIGGIGYSFLGRQPAGGPQLEIRSRRYEYG